MNESCDARRRLLTKCVYIFYSSGDRGDGMKKERRWKRGNVVEQSRGRLMNKRERLCRGSHWTAVRWHGVRFAPSMGPVLLITYTCTCKWKATGGWKGTKRRSHRKRHTPLLFSSDQTYFACLFLSSSLRLRAPPHSHLSIAPVWIYIVKGCHKYAQRLAGCAGSLLSPLPTPPTTATNPSNPNPRSRKKKRKNGGRPRRMDQVAKFRQQSNQPTIYSTWFDKMPAAPEMTVSAFK